MGSVIRRNIFVRINVIYKSFLPFLQITSFVIRWCLVVVARQIEVASQENDKKNENISLRVGAAGPYPGIHELLHVKVENDRLCGSIPWSVAFMYSKPFFLHVVLQLQFHVTQMKRATLTLDSTDIILEH